MKQLSCLAFCTLFLLTACKEEPQKLEGGEFILKTEKTTSVPIIKQAISETKEETNQLWISDLDGFKEITNYPVCYSHEPVSVRISLKRMSFQKIPIEHYSTILPSSIIVDSNEAVFPMHRCAQKMYTFATYLIRSEDSEYGNEPFSDRIYLVVYNQGDSIISSTGGWMKDEYDSFYELSVTSSTTITTRTCDREYSPDEEQAKKDLVSGISHIPTIYTTDFLINHETLTFEPVLESTSLDQR